MYHVYLARIRPTNLRTWESELFRPKIQLRPSADIGSEMWRTIEGVRRREKGPY
jgi:hypothetical protein